jgi:hypothetical protein
VSVKVIHEKEKGAFRLVLKPAKHLLIHFMSTAAVKPIRPDPPRVRRLKQGLAS